MILASFIIPAAISVAVNFALAYAAYWVCSQIAGKSKLKMPEASNYPIQSSMKGIPIPIIYGTTRTAGEVIWLGELYPYTVEHNTGGKGGSGSSSTIGETRYKRSFLISLGYGPMSVLRIWANKKLIWPYNAEGIGQTNFILAGQPIDGQYFLNAVDVTIFEGLDNSGVPALTGEAYGEYKRNCLLFFNEYDLGSTKALPNIVAEVSRGEMSYFLGMHFGTGSDRKIVYKINSDNTIDDTWADSGAWHYEPPDPHSGSTAACYDLAPMQDGRLLVAHNVFWIEGTSVGDGGKLIACTMLTASGEIDTSWGYNGHYIIRQSGAEYPFVNPRKFIRCLNGDFILIASCNSGSTYSIHRFDKDGNMVYARYWTEGVNNARCQIFYDAVWADDSQTRLIAVGSAQNSPGGGVFNCMALDPETGDTDTSWPGNMSEPGYANIKATGITTLYAYNIERLSDGSFVISFGPSNNDDRTLVKLTADGEIDENFGVDGFLEAGYISGYDNLVFDGVFIWTLGNKREGGTTTTNIKWWRKYDVNGILIDSEEFSTMSLDNYRLMLLGPGHCLFSMSGYLEVDLHDVKRYSLGMNEIDGFEFPGSIFGYDINVICPMGPTRNNLNCNPAYIIKDLLTNPIYGGMNEG